MYVHISTGLRKGNLKGKYHLVDLGIDGRIIFRCILNRMGRALIIRLTEDTDMAGSCEHGNELPGSIKYREFLDLLRN
jgi:hypothetical protein